MSESADFARAVKSAGISFACGVPDSLLKGVIAQLESFFGPNHFVTAANEGSAIGLAIGYHLATAEVPMVFMQNSGLGNSVNPLLSLAHRDVWKIPMVLLIGWRGEVLLGDVQIEDEPQHQPQGRETLRLLEALAIPARILEPGGDAQDLVHEAVLTARDTSGPVALVVRKGALGSGPSFAPQSPPRELPSRETMVRAVAHYSVSSGAPAIPIVSTTGMASRELDSIRSRMQHEGERAADLLTVGGMGHAVSIATGVAMKISPSRIICLDGDGALLMHAGALRLSAKQSNLIHVLLNNGVHDSVGAQTTGVGELKLEQIVLGFGYKRYHEVRTIEQLQRCLESLAVGGGSTFINAVCSPGNRADLGRPALSPHENRSRFMAHLAAGFQP